MSTAYVVTLNQTWDDAKPEGPFRFMQNFSPFYQGIDEDYNRVYRVEYKGKDSELDDAQADLEEHITSWKAFVDGHWEYD